MVQIGGRLELDFNSCRRESGGEDKKGVVRPAGFLCRTQKNILDIDPLASRRGRYIWGADLTLLTLKAPGDTAGLHIRGRYSSVGVTTNFPRIFTADTGGSRYSESSSRGRSGPAPASPPQNEGTREKNSRHRRAKASSTFRNYYRRAVRAGNPGPVTSTVLQSLQL